MTIPSADSSTGWLDRLDALPPLRFVATLYVVRWIVVIPYMVLAMVLGGGGTVQFDASPIVLLFGFLILSPVIETLLECTLPYVLLSLIKPMPRRDWVFIAISAAIMAVLHPYLSAVIPSLITGAFLAYCYAQFAPLGHARAIGWTWLFHAGINLVGWVMVALL